MMASNRRRSAAAIVLLVLAGCATNRGLDPTRIDLPAAERLSDREVLEIVDAVGRFHVRGYSLLAERSSVAEAREMAGDALSAEEALIEERSAVAGPRRSHHLARSVLDRESMLADGLPPGAGPEQTAAFLRRLAEQDRWFIILIDNALAPSAASGIVRRQVADVRAHTLTNLARLRALRATL